MTAQLTLQFNNTEELFRLLQYLKDNGLERIAFNSNPVREKPTETQKRVWTGIGSVNLGNALDAIPNLRDYAYE